MGQPLASGADREGHRQHSKLPPDQNQAEQWVARVGGLVVQGPTELQGRSASMGAHTQC